MFFLNDKVKLVPTGQKAVVIGRTIQAEPRYDVKLDDGVIRNYLYQDMLARDEE